MAEQAELREHNKRDADGSGGDALPQELGAGREAEAAALDDLDVVVGKTDGAEGERGKDSNPDEGIGRIGPEDCGEQDGDADEDAAHGGGAGFFEVRLRAVFANELADLELAQFLNDVGADEKRDHERRERGKGGAEGEVAEDPEGVKERKELFVEQPVKQGASDAGMRRVSG